MRVFAFIKKGGKGLFNFYIPYLFLYTIYTRERNVTFFYFYVTM